MSGINPSLIFWHFQLQHPAWPTHHVAFNRGRVRLSLRMMPLTLAVRQGDPPAICITTGCIMVSREQRDREREREREMKSILSFSLHFIAGQQIVYGKRVQQIGGNLHIESVQRDDAGDFVCIATSVASGARQESPPAKLSVICKYHSYPIQ